MRGSQAVHGTDPIHPGFAKTVPARGLLQVVVGKREASTTVLLLCSVSSRTMVITSLHMPGGAEAQLSHLEGHENPNAGKKVERVNSHLLQQSCDSEKSWRATSLGFGP